MLNEQHADISWKSIIYNLPRRELSLPLGLLSMHSLHSEIYKCDLCNNTQTLHHVLNHCQTMLTQGRYTWRHDSILSYIWQVVQSSELVSNESIRVNVDLPGSMTSNISTIPVNILPTSNRPDMVLFRPQEKEIFIFELTFHLRII